MCMESTRSESDWGPEGLLEVLPQVVAISRRNVALWQRRAVGRSQLAETKKSKKLLLDVNKVKRLVALKELLGASSRTAGAATCLGE